MKSVSGILAFALAGALATYALRVYLPLSGSPLCAWSIPMAECDLGQVPGGAVVTLNLGFKNPGDRPVAFDQVEGGCSCANLGARAFTIAPGSSYLLPVRLDLRSKSGAGVAQVKGTLVGSARSRVIGVMKYEIDPVGRIWVIPQGDGRTFMPGSGLEVLVYTNDPHVSGLKSADQVTCAGDGDMDLEVIEAWIPQAEQTDEHRLLYCALVRVNGLFGDLVSNLTVTLPASVDGVTLSMTTCIGFSSGIVIRPHLDDDALTVGLEIVDVAVGERQMNSDLEASWSSTLQVKRPETILAVVSQTVGDEQPLASDLEIHARGETVRQRICPQFWRILAEG